MSSHSSSSLVASSKRLRPTSAACSIAPHSGHRTLHSWRRPHGSRVLTLQLEPCTVVRISTYESNLPHVLLAARAQRNWAWLMVCQCYRVLRGMRLSSATKSTTRSKRCRRSPAHGLQVLGSDRLHGLTRSGVHEMIRRGIIHHQCLCMAFRMHARSANASHLDPAAWRVPMPTLARQRLCIPVPVMYKQPVMYNQSCICKSCSAPCS